MDLPNDISACHALILKQQEQIIRLEAQVAMLLQKVAELTDRLNKNSRNSNQPPSSDGLKKPASKPAFSRKTTKKQGGQSGHKGKTLEFCQQPDHINLLLPETCSCGHSLDKNKAEPLEVRQVFDLPAPKLEVTQHVLLGCVCPKCGSQNQGEFPVQISSRVQYGTGVKALIVLLNVGLKLPIQKVQHLFTDLFGTAINAGTIINATQKCFNKLESSEKAIKERLLESQVNHFDETGMRVAGRLHWLHTCCNTLFTCLFVHTHRGKKALKDATVSIISKFKGWAVHDCWSSYFNFTDCSHALCGAHIIRELVALEEKGNVWPKTFRRYLLALYRMTGQGTGVLTEEQQKKAQHIFDSIWEYADKIEPPPKKPDTGKGKPKATKGRNLLIRLKKHQSAVLAFAFHAHIPFTNNQAERDLRPAKTKLKVAGSFRTLEGARIYARIFGFISTVRKHQKNVFIEIKAAFEGQTFLTNNTPY